jgi:hypothetical protein
MLRRPSPSMILALIALAVALSGVAYAAFRLPANSVKSKHIANGQVKSPDLANNGVTGTDVEEGSLNGASIPDVADPRMLASGRVQVDDPDGGGTTSSILVIADDFTVNGDCQGSGAGATGTIKIDAGLTYAVFSTGGATGGVDLASTNSQSNLMSVSNVDPSAGGTFQATTLNGTSALHGFMQAAVTGNNTCVFSVSAITDKPQPPD